MWIANPVVGPHSATKKISCSQNHKQSDITHQEGVPKDNTVENEFPSLISPVTVSRNREVGKGSPNANPPASLSRQEKSNGAWGYSKWE